MPEARVGTDHPLYPLTQGWSSKLKQAWDEKKRRFQDDADECMRFFNGPYDWIYDVKTAREKGAFTFVGDETELPRLSFAMTVNKAAELVQLFGPALYYQNPVRQVNPRKYWLPPAELYGDPSLPQTQMRMQQVAQQVNQGRLQDEARASLVGDYLNYTPAALELERHSRFAITEALLKGLGVLWPEVYRPAGSGMQMAGSFYDTVDNLLIDPDAETLDEARWVARRVVCPYWQAEDDFGLPRDYLRGAATAESQGRQAETITDPKGTWNRQAGRTNDLMVYWKIYSKMGMGGRMSGVQPGLREKLDPLGKFPYLCISEVCGHPLNVPPEISAGLMSDDEAVYQQALQACQQGFQWPTPFWADDTWPFEPIGFHWVPRTPWPMSHLRPGMGELKFLNWAYSMLAGKIKNSCRDFIGILKSAGEDIKENIRVGPDYTMLEIDVLHGDIDKVVKFLQHPSFQKDIYDVIDRVADNFERRTGLTELMYGMSAKQMRSAEEASVKEGQATIRPDDMAKKVEEAMSKVSRKEAFLARWHLEAADVQPVLGPVGSQWWEQLVTNESPSAILHGLEYRIEAGSVRKPNKATQQQNMNNAMQTLFQPLMQYAMQSGNVEPVNALISQWAKASDFDAQKFLLAPPPPPPAAPGPPMPGAPAKRGP
jgi:hypothetical protein